MKYICHTTETHSSIFNNIMCDSTSHCLRTVTRMLTTTNNLSSQAHFHYTVSASSQVSVKHILFDSFIQLQHVLPLSSTSKSLTLYCSLTPKIQCTAGMPSPSAHSWALCKNETRKCRSENVIHLVSVIMLHFQCKVNSVDDTDYSQYSVFVTKYWSTVDNLFWIQLKGGWQNWICKLGYNFKFHNVKVCVHCVQIAHLIHIT